MRVAVLFISKEPDKRKEMIEIRERVVHLETKVEELTKRVDGLSKYMKDLYARARKTRVQENLKALATPRGKSVEGFLS